MSDKVRYNTYARRETHPARIGAIARLYGLDLPPVDRCSVLEIGCGDGGNLIPLAVRNPHSRFVGIDLAEDSIEWGVRDCAALGVTNLSLRCADVASVELDAHSFDYVVCHGVFSWVAPDVQAAIFRLARRCLGSQGILFVSYNTYPGWRQRGAIRDILSIAARQCDPAASDRERYEAGMEFLGRVSRERQESSDPYGAYLRESYERLKLSEPAYVIQEFLGPYNTPLSFRDFMVMADAHDLQFVSEARVSMMSSEDLSDEAKARLRTLHGDTIAQEELLDIFRNRMFRETLLCDKRHVLNRGLKTEEFQKLYFVANYIPVDGGAESNRFKERTTSREVETPPGDCSRMLSVVASLGARGGTVYDIIDASRQVMLTSERESLSILATLWRAGFLDALTAPQSVFSSDSKLIKACPWAKIQAARASKVTSCLHESYELSDLERVAISMAETKMSIGALSTLLLPQASQEEIRCVIESLIDRGLLG